MGDLSRREQKKTPEHSEEYDPQTPECAGENGPQTSRADAELSPFPQHALDRLGGCPPLPWCIQFVACFAVCQVRDDAFQPSTNRRFQFTSL